jgi:RNA polymerase sigma-70 factor (ECF subfamily)
MNKLSPAWSSVMQLKYLEQKDGKEICQDLGITSSNFWQILCRAKLQVRACIEKNWFLK